MNRPARTLRDAIAAFEAAGRTVAGLRVYPNGTVDILTEGPAAPPVANDDGDWVALAGQTEIPRAHRP